MVQVELSYCITEFVYWFNHKSKRERES